MIFRFHGVVQEFKTNRNLFQKLAVIPFSIILIRACLNFKLDNNLVWTGHRFSNSRYEVGCTVMRYSFISSIISWTVIFSWVSGLSLLRRVASTARASSEPVVFIEISFYVLNLELIFIKFAQFR